MSSHSTERGSQEHDPTGVRNLLSSLPDPGPMPEDLVERITASLEREQQDRARQRDTSNVSPLTTARSRRSRRSRPLLVAGIAAAGLAVVAVAGPQLAGSGSNEVPDAAPVPAVGVGKQDSPAPSRIEFHESDTDYTSAGFAKQAGEVRDASQEKRDPSQMGQLGQQLTLDRCLQGVKSVVGNNPERIIIDAATFDDAPALVVMVTKDGSTQAWAIGMQCAAGGDAPILAGPTDVTDA